MTFLLFIKREKCSLEARRISFDGMKDDICIVFFRLLVPDLSASQLVRRVLGKQQAHVMTYIQLGALILILSILRRRTTLKKVPGETNCGCIRHASVYIPTLATGTECWTVLCCMISSSVFSTHFCFRPEIIFLNKQLNHAKFV